MIWARSLPDITEIVDILNSIDPNIKFLAETSEELNRPSGGLPFLDVEAYFKEGEIHFDLYHKETDTFNYLPFSSSHPRHCVRNIPYSLARRIVVIVSEQHNVTKQLNLLKRRLINKGYPEKLIEESINRAKTVSRDEILLNDSNRNNGNQNPLNEYNISPVYYVSTHNPRSKNLFSDIEGITENLNQALPTDKAVKVRPSFRKSASLKDQLMFRKLNQPTVKKCGKDCIFCTYIQTGSSITLKNGKTVRTNSNFDCGSRNVVYIATCGNCEENYIGETGDRLLTRWTVHRQQSKLSYEEAPVQADVHLRLCGKNQYKVFPFFRPRRNCMFLRRRYEENFIRSFTPKLNGRLV